MKTQTKLLLAALALGASTWILAAQDDTAAPPKGDRPPRREGFAPGGPGGGGQGQRPMVAPLFAALDANHDGVIDEKEIQNAAKALKTLDKNNDGKITPDEIRPPRPEGAPGPAGQGQGRRGGPGGQGRGPGGPPPGDAPEGPAHPAPEQ